MANFGFYSSTENDRRIYSADDFSRIFDGLIRDGVYAGYGGNFSVSADGSGMKVTVASGRAWFNHTWTYYDTNQDLSIANASGINDRWDSVVLEVNTATRTNVIKVITGAYPSGGQVSPVPPTMANGENGVYQHRLANIRVNHGVSKITNANVYNTVGVNDETPFVTVIADINTPITTLVRQYTDQFEDWFDNLNTQLSGDVAANLQRQINEITEATQNTYITPGTTIRFPRVNVPARIANTRNKFVFSIPAGGLLSSDITDVSFTASEFTLYDSASEILLSWDVSGGITGSTLTFVPYFEYTMIEFVFDYNSALYSFPKGMGWVFLDNLELTFS